MGVRPRSHHLDDSDIHPQIQDLKGELEHAQNIILEYQFLMFATTNELLRFWKHVNL